MVSNGTILSEAGVTAKDYDHYAYDKKKQTAMRAWGRYIN